MSEKNKESCENCEHCARLDDLYCNARDRLHEQEIEMLAERDHFVAYLQSRNMFLEHKDDPVTGKVYSRFYAIGENNTKVNVDQYEFALDTGFSLEKVDFYLNCWFRGLLPYEQSETVRKDLD
jgi:hypothetical protein